MGSTVAYTGWQGRLASDKEVALKSRSSHRQIAPWMFLFMALGYTGGLLSLVMQKQPILESPHFWTGTALLGVLAINGLIAFSGFAGNKDALRITHAYLGTLAISIMLIHGILGLKLGLSI
jgi:fucose 4-O-acetylase-like acetyltransferase